MKIYPFGCKNTERVSKEKLESKRINNKRPRNVKATREIKINEPIYSKLSKSVKLRDASYRKIQGNLAKAVISRAKVAETVIAMITNDGKEGTAEEWQEAVEGWGKAMYDDLFDSIPLTAQSSYDINMKRVNIIITNMYNMPCI